MKTKKLTHFLTATVLFSLVACAESTRDKNKNNPAKGAQNTTTSNKNSQEGSQPGQVYISGVMLEAGDEKLGVVNENTIVLKDSHILKFDIKAGKNKAGQQTTLTAHLELKKEIDSATTQSLQNLTNANTLVNLGCSDENIKRMDLKANLETKKVTETEVTQPLVIEANTIVICGEIPYKHSMFSLKADTLVMQDAKLSRVAESHVGKTSFIANRMVIKGKSLIEQKAKDGYMGQLPTIHLTAAQKFEAETDSTVTIKSFGADAKAEQTNTTKQDSEKVKR